MRTSEGRTEPAMRGRVTQNLLFLVALILFSGVVWLAFNKVDFTEVLSRISLAELLLNVFLALLFTAAFGRLMSAGFHGQFGIKVSPTEVLTLPLMMQLFTFLIPIKGGLLFQAFYMRHRHGLAVSGGFSLGLMIFLISVVMAITMGMALNFYLKLGYGPLFIFLAILGAGLIVACPLIALSSRLPKPTRSWLLQLWEFVLAVREQLVAQAGNRRLLAQLVIWSCILVLIQTLWFQQTAVMLDFRPDFLTMLLVTLVLRIVLLVRLLPGNLGIQEVLIGLVFATAGLSLEEGLLVALVNRVVSTVLAMTIGMGALYFLIQSVNYRSIRDLIKKPSQ